MRGRHTFPQNHPIGFPLLDTPRWAYSWAAVLDCNHIIWPLQPFTSLPMNPVCITKMDQDHRPDALRSIRGKLPPIPAFSKDWPLWTFDLAVGAVNPPSQRALLIGINYDKAPCPKTFALRQPRQDVTLMKDYLIDVAGWSEDSIIVMTDAKTTPQDLRPTHANIMREIERLGKSQCDNVLFLYTGHADQRPQPKQPPLSPTSSARLAVEEDGLDQFIIPVDAVKGPGVIDENLIVLDDTLHDCLIPPLSSNATLLAIFDTCHSATLLDLKHHRCNRIRTMASLFRRAVRRVLIEPFSKPRGKDADTGNSTKTEPFLVSQICDGLCPRDQTNNSPIAVSISACKDREQVYEGGTSLVQTTVELLRSNSSASLRDVIDALLHNKKYQQRSMRHAEKRYKEAGNRAKTEEMRKARKEAQKSRPQISSSTPLDLRRHHSGPRFTLEMDL